MERLEPLEQPERLDIRVPPVLQAKLGLQEQLAGQVQAVLRAKLGLRELVGLPESQGKQELRDSLELLGRLAKQELLELRALPVPRDLRVVVVQVEKLGLLVEPAQLVKLD